MSKPAVCFVAPWVYPIISGDRSSGFAGGAEVQQAAIARGLRDLGYSVSFLAADFGQPDETEHEGLRFIKIWHAQDRSLPGIRYFHPRLTGLWKGMKRAGASIYYVRDASAFTFVAGRYARRHDTRFVFASASDLNYEKPRTRELFAGRGAWREHQLFVSGLQLADTLVAQHPRQVELARRWYGREAQWIRSCYSPPVKAHSAAKGVVLWVGMLRDGKHPERFLDLARSLPHLKFRMIGGAGSVHGSTEEGRRFYAQIELMARRLVNVEFCGFVPYGEVERHFDEARVFVNTSDHEGFPNTFLQAWSRGIPTVSFFDADARDETGAIGVVAQNETELSAAVARLTSDFEEWQSIGSRCRRYFELHHSVQSVVSRYDVLFSHLMSRR